MAGKGRVKTQKQKLGKLLAFDALSLKFLNMTRLVENYDDWVFLTLCVQRSVQGL